MANSLLQSNVISNQIVTSRNANRKVGNTISVGQGFCFAFQNAKHKPRFRAEPSLFIPTLWRVAFLITVISLTAIAQSLNAHCLAVVDTKEESPKAEDSNRYSDDGEFLIDPIITLAPAPGNQHSPAIAFDGTNYLVVWQEDHSGNYNIYGTRITPDGVVLDTAGIAISTNPNDQLWPKVCFDGTNYLVVWEDKRSGGSDIYGARVGPDGAVLDPSGVPISTAPESQRSPAVSFDGTNFLVVWQDNRKSNSSDIYGARVSPGGVLLDTSGILLSQAPNEQCSPAITFDGTNYLVVWQDFRKSYSNPDIYGCRVTRDGVVLDSAGFAITTEMVYQYQLPPKVSFDGTNYLVVWENDYGSIYGARVTKDGVVLDTMSVPIVPTWQRAHTDYSPWVAFDGTNYLIVWSDYRTRVCDIYGARVTKEGVVLDPDGFPICTAVNSQVSPGVAFDGTNYLVVWRDGRGADYDINGARVSQNGKVLDTVGFIVSTTVNSQTSPAVCSDSTDYIVVWEDYRSGYLDIYGMLVSSEGVIFDTSGFPISIAENSQCSPAIGFGNTNFLVVWQDARSGNFSDIYGARVDKDGNLLDPDGIPISTAADWQVSSVVAFDGTNYLVVWQDYRSGNGSSDIYGARVDRDGNVLDPNGIPIATVVNWQISPAVAFNGTNYFVVWADSRNGSYDIYGARVDKNGTVLDPNGIPISTATYSQWSPAIAFDGINYLIVWEDSRSGVSYDIYGARVDKDGYVLDPDGIPIATAVNNQYYPAVVFDGRNYLVVWTDYSRREYNIYGAWVSPDGAVFDSGPVVRQEGAQLYPALARSQGNSLFLVYQGWAGKVGGKNYNTCRIWGKMNPAPGVEERFLATTNGSRLTATIVRNVLFLPSVESGERMAVGASFFDITGRKVMDLKPGPNDVRHLSPGVYFIRCGSSIDRKVVITK